MSDNFAEKAKIWDSNPLVRGLADKFKAELNKIVPTPTGLTILELGCGTGLVGLHYADRADSLILVDTSKAMLDVLRTKKEANADHVVVHEGTLTTLTQNNFRPQSIDWIFSNMALHHVEDIPSLLQELYKLLKPGGRVTIGDLETEPGTFHAPEVVPHNGFEVNELAQQFEKEGFTVTATYTYLTMPKTGGDGVTRDYKAFILDATSNSPK